MSNLFIILYLIAPIIVSFIVRNSKVDWLKIIPLLMIWIPFESDLFLLDKVISPIEKQTVPFLEIPALFAAIIVLYTCYFGILKTVKLSEFKPTKDFKYAIISYLGILAALMPLGLAMGFLEFNLKELTFGSLGKFLFIFLFIAMPEEVIFRAVFQNFLVSKFKKTIFAIVLGAIFFGLTHINNTTAFHAPPNYAYVLMASIAGFGYGYCYYKSSSLFYSTIVHTGVNFIWWALFKLV